MKTPKTSLTKEQKGVDMIGVRNILDKLEQVMVAVAFAEAGDHQSALEIMNEKSRRKKRKRPGSRKRRRVQNAPVLRA
ncbi:hypothetical protein ACFL0Q_06215 [Thermodesulfobacteriota bacterium]